MARKSLLDNLNDRQAEAATTLEGPVLIIAGAGSGKTRALTHRLAHLIESGVDPRTIVALTFTNKAAGEMRSRVNDLVGLEKANAPFVGTFHALGVRILRREMHHLNRSHDFVIYDTKDQRALLKDILATHNMPSDRFGPGRVHHTISQQKNELVGPSAYETSASSFYERAIAPVYYDYENALRDAGAVDFDDLLGLPVQLFREHEHLLTKYQEWWQHLLVDEYQDTNHAQYVLLRLLASKYRNLCVVGDDWQSIYRFRGADFRNILQFEQDWPDATVVFLEENYRSSQPILDAAQSVIEKNQFRTHKKLWTQQKEGQKPQIIQVDDEMTEGIWVLNELEHLSRNGEVFLHDAVVLYRTNAQSRIFEELLVGRGIPYNIVGSVRFYERREIKDVIAYLRLIYNPSDTVALRRIANVPARGIGKVTLEKMLNKAFNNDSQKNIRDFYNLIAELKELSTTLPLGEFTKKLLSKTKYKAHLTDGTREGEERWENVEELVSVASSFGDDPASSSLPTFLEEVALLSPTDDIADSSGVLNLMTLHAVKGLEFDTVFISGCEEGLLPHEKSILSPEELEEERRLMYVGMTRAKKRLYMTFARSRTLFGSSRLTLPSRFLGDIPEELIEFTASEEDPIKIIEI